MPLRLHLSAAIYEAGVHEQEFLAEVYVQDTGVGVAKNQCSYLLHHQWYRQQIRYRCGLMLYREFVAKNGGRLLLENRESYGSTFSFTLPKADVYVVFQPALKSVNIHRTFSKAHAVGMESFLSFDGLRINWLRMTGEWRIKAKVKTFSKLISNERRIMTILLILKSAVNFFKPSCSNP